MVSCNQDDTETLVSSTENTAEAEQYFNGHITLEDDYLKFDSEESYNLLFSDNDSVETEVLAEISENIDYTSLSELVDNPNAKQLIGPKTQEIIENSDFLKTVVNNNGMISIGEHIFKLNFESELVYVLNEENDSLISNLEKEEADLPEIMLFSMEDDVLSLLNNGYTESPTLTQSNNTKTANIFCAGGCGGLTGLGGGLPIYSLSYPKYYVKSGARYLRAGIFFSLQLEIYVVNDFHSVGLPTSYPKAEYTTHCETQCNRTWHTRTASSNDLANTEYRRTSQEPGDNVWEHKYREKIYEGVQGLRKYYINLKGHCIASGSSSTNYPKPTYYKTCNW